MIYILLPSAADDTSRHVKLSDLTFVTLYCVLYTSTKYEHVYVKVELLLSDGRGFSMWSAAKIFFSSDVR